MRDPSPKSRIIPTGRLARATLAALLLTFCMALLGGCSMVRMGYNQAPTLAYWWIDGYADFTDTQQPQVRDAVDAWFAWHRRTQLPAYAALLDRAQGEVLKEATPAQLCGWSDELRARANEAAQQAVPALAEVALMLSSDQVRHVERRFEKSMKDFQSDYLQNKPDDRTEAAVKRVVDRMEMVYGPLTEAQHGMIVAGVKASPFDPVAWGAERRERQKNVVAALRRLRADHADAGAARAAVRQLIDDAFNSPQPAYREYQQRLIQYNCGFAAQMQNTTNAEQRQAAAKRLRGWAEDARALSTQGAPAP